MFKFQLFIAGFSSETSQVAINNVKNFLKKNIPDEYSFSIIDVIDDPECARSKCIYATPVLVKTRPKPESRIFGSLKDKEKVFEALGIGLTNEKW